MSPRVAPGPARSAIPAQALDLIDCPRVAALMTLMPDGRPQTTVVWCTYDGGRVFVNTMRGFQKERNMRRDPRVTLLGYDPRQSWRALEVRGTVVAMTEEGALAQLDALCVRYTGASPYFGACVAAELAATERPVLCMVQPTRVVALDATEAYRGAQGISPPASGCVSHGSGEERLTDAHRIGTGPPIPDSHRDLLARPIVGVLTTLMPDGQPQSSLVWCDDDGVCARVNTTRQRQKGKNMAADPRVTLLLVDPDDTSRFLEIRGDVALIEAGAIEHLDTLTRSYTRHPHFYGRVYPAERQARETRMIARIAAVRITCDAIHR